MNLVVTQLPAPAVAAKAYVGVRAGPG